MAHTLERSYNAMWECRQALGLAATVVPRPGVLPHIVVHPSDRRTPTPHAQLLRDLARVDAAAGGGDAGDAGDVDGLRARLARRVGGEPGLAAVRRMQCRLASEFSQGMALHQVGGGRLLVVCGCGCGCGCVPGGGGGGGVGREVGSLSTHPRIA